MSARSKWLKRSGIHYKKQYQKSRWHRSYIGKKVGQHRFNRKYKKGKAVEGIDFYTP